MPQNEIAPDEIEVTSFPLDEDAVVPLLRVRPWLSPDEIERAERFRFEIHRERFIRGRGMMRALLARRLGSAPSDLVFGVGEKGKPHLIGSDLQFNLSHSEGRAAFAIGEVSGIGIDLECLDRRVDHDGLSRRCFRESEIEWMNGFPTDQRHVAFFRIWTAKEARMKATGEGFQLEPKRIELGFEDGFPRRCLEPLAPPAHLVSMRFPEGGVACSVVALAPFRARFSGLPDLGTGGCPAP